MLLRSREVEWFSNTVGGFYAAKDSAELCGAVISALFEPFRMTAVGIEESAYDQSAYWLIGARAEAAPPPGYEACIHDHPALPLVVDHGAPLLVHLASHPRYSSWNTTDHFHGLAKPMGWCDQVALCSRDAGSFAVASLVRDGVFSEAERAWLALLAPHFRAAWHRVHPQRNQVKARPQPTLLTFTSDGRLPELEPGLRMLLKAYFPDWRDATRLPARVAEWVCYELGKLRQRMPLHALHKLTVDSARGRLALRIFPDTRSGSHRLALTEMPAVPSFLDLRRRGLTQRECEILHWVAQGKRDAEIAVIIGSARATVSKHLESVFRKLGVDNRSAAAARAWDLLGRTVRPGIWSNGQSK